MNHFNESDWQITMNKVTARGKYILENGLWTDCKFLVGEVPNQQELSAHKLFLSMASPVFDLMFHGEMAERSIVTVNDIQPEAFKAMLLYVYTDEVDLQTFDQACELCYVAKKYMMPQLVKICTEYLWKDLNKDNACRAFEFSRLFEESILMDKSMAIIRNETLSIIDDVKFSDAELPTLLAILDQENLNIESELQLFRAVYKWAVAECLRKEMPIEDDDSLWSVAQPAVHKIRFLTMTAAEFSSEPAKSKLLRQSEAFAILMNLCSDKENYPMPDGFSTITTARHMYVVPPYVRDKNCLQPTCCKMMIIQQTPVKTFGNTESGFSFTVSKDIIIIGIQVFSQALMQSNTQNVFPNVMGDSAADEAQDATSNQFYKESIYAQLLGDDNLCITFCHFQKSVKWNSLIDINFNVPYRLTKNKTYRINVILRKNGWYIMGKYFTEPKQNLPLIVLSNSPSVVRAIIYQP